MSLLPRLVRQTLTIARRDFVATVFTPTFLLFLLAPLIMVSFGAIGGIGAANVADSATQQLRVVAIVPAALAPDVEAADRRLRRAFRPPEALPQLLVLAPERDPAEQARALFRGGAVEASAALHGPLEAPSVLYGPGGRGDADYLALVADLALRLHTDGDRAPPQPRIQPVERPGVSASGRNQLGFFAVFGIFFLTLLLAGQAVGTMAEERASKVIEILAASAPLETVFLGKLIGMFGVAVLFVGFWAAMLGLAAGAAPPGLAQALAGIGPAIGWPAFTALFLIYFTLSYLLLGATFLGIGAQASTPREIQMLSLPITVAQVGMFALASAAASKPESTLARVAEVFPLSSPLAMAARAANQDALWPHLLAVPWAALWVAIVITVGARAFRRGVLQSGGRPGWLARRTRRS